MSSRRTWAIVLNAVVILPLLGALLSPPSKYGAWANLSTGLGLLATSLMVIIVLFVSRVRGLTRWLGLELGNDLHRRLGTAVMVATLAHLGTALMASSNDSGLINPLESKLRFSMGTMATLVMLVIGYLAVPRASGRRYGSVVRVHGLLAIVALIFTALHIVMIGHVFYAPLIGVPMALIGILLVGVLGWRWVVRPLLNRGAYALRAVRPESSHTATVILDPLAGRPDAPFEPGQFVWLRRTRAVGLTVEHPFTVAASTRTGILELTVRNRGRFTGELLGLPPGSRVWLDGPHGSFVPTAPYPTPQDPRSREGGLVLIAGGVGITPIMSILRAHAAGSDPRPHRLLLAERPHEALFGPELLVLERRLDLDVRRTEGRRLDPALLLEVLPATRRELEDYFVCGPPSLVDAALHGLGSLGVPGERIRTEQFG